jgi:hypothetical protein
MSTVKSLAKTDRDYTPVRFRFLAAGQMKIQVNLSPPVNRSYGLRSIGAFEPVNATEADAHLAFFKSATKSNSLAGTKEQYAEALVRESNGNLKWQVPVSNPHGFSSHIVRDGYVSFVSSGADHPELVAFLTPKTALKMGIAAVAPNNLVEAFVPSLAGTGAEYLRGQIRITSNGRIRFQAALTKAENRDYGFAEKTEKNSTYRGLFDVVIANASGKNSSLADTGQTYSEVRVRASDSNLKWQVPATSMEGVPPSNQRKGYISFTTKGILPELLEFLNNQ